MLLTLKVLLKLRMFQKQSFPILSVAGNCRRTAVERPQETGSHSFPMAQDSSSSNTLRTCICESSWLCAGWDSLLISSLHSHDGSYNFWATSWYGWRGGTCSSPRALRHDILHNAAGREGLCHINLAPPKYSGLLHSFSVQYVQSIYSRHRLLSPMCI